MNSEKKDTEARKILKAGPEEQRILRDHKRRSRMPFVLLFFFLGLHGKTGIGHGKKTFLRDLGPVDLTNTVGTFLDPLEGHIDIVQDLLLIGSKTDIKFPVIIVRRHIGDVGELSGVARHFRRTITG